MDAKILYATCHLILKLLSSLISLFLFQHFKMMFFLLPSHFNNLAAFALECFFRRSCFSLNVFLIQQIYHIQLEADLISSARNSLRFLHLKHLKCRCFYHIHKLFTAFLVLSDSVCYPCLKVYLIVREACIWNIQSLLVLDSCHLLYHID